MNIFLCFLFSILFGISSYFAFSSLPTYYEYTEADVLLQLFAIFCFLSSLSFFCFFIESIFKDL